MSRLFKSLVQVGAGCGRMQPTLIVRDNLSGFYNPDAALYFVHNHDSAGMFFSQRNLAAGSNSSYFYRHDCIMARKPYSMKTGYRSPR